MLIKKTKALGNKEGWKILNSINALGYAERHNDEVMSSKKGNQGS
jgi:hypothetical protein